MIVIFMVQLGMETALRREPADDAGGSSGRNGERWNVPGYGRIGGNHASLSDRDAGQYDDMRADPTALSNEDWPITRALLANRTPAVFELVIAVDHQAEWTEHRIVADRNQVIGVYDRSIVNENAVADLKIRLSFLPAVVHALEMAVAADKKIGASGNPGVPGYCSAPVDPRAPAQLHAEFPHPPRFQGACTVSTGKLLKPGQHQTQNIGRRIRSKPAV